MAAKKKIPPPKKAAKKKAPAKKKKRKKLRPPSNIIPPISARSVGQAIENTLTPWYLVKSNKGRPRLFAEPEEMEQAAVEYFKYNSSRKWDKKELIKGGFDAGMICDVPSAIPYTWEGLCRYLCANTKYFNDFRDRCKTEIADKELDPKLREKAKHFSEVIMWIGQVIYQQKFEGAAVGAFDRVIMSRDLQLVEKKEQGFTDKDGNRTDPPKPLIITQILPNIERDI